jgi:glycosyltransferase involved in cell wall biosynthesis
MDSREPGSIRVDAVIPVYNEQHVLGRSIATLHDFLSRHLPYDWRIVIADNASTDDTLMVARGLAERMERVDVLHLDKKGRGRALRAAWLGSQADVLSYMDVDLSTDLAAYPPLIRAIAEGGYDLATGRRLGKGARVEKRRLLREITSRGYNLIIKAGFRTRFTDAQCGFKAISRRAADALLPLVQNNEWFFDTELLILAEKKGYRTRQIPVHWIDDPDTRVKVVGTAMEDLRGLWRLKRAGY